MSKELEYVVHKINNHRYDYPTTNKASYNHWNIIIQSMVYYTITPMQAELYEVAGRELVTVL